MNLRPNILLTATINTNNCAYLKRSNAEQRKGDYIQTIERWLNNTDFDLVFCENSNYDLSSFVDLFKAQEDRIEFISFDGNQYPRSFGKGYGEIDTIKRAIKISEKLKSSDYLHKVTGRYYLSEVGNYILDLEKNKNYKLVVKNSPESNLYYTTYFSIDKTLMSKIKNIANDSGGIYAEHVLFSATRHLQSNEVRYIDTLGVQKDQVTGTGNQILTHLK